MPEDLQTTIDAVNEEFDKHTIEVIETHINEQLEVVESKYKDIFNKIFPDDKLSPEQLVAGEAELAKYGIKVLRNAAGVAGKIRLPNGQIVDVIRGAASGENVKQWLTNIKWFPPEFPKRIAKALGSTMRVIIDWGRSGQDMKETKKVIHLPNPEA